MATINMDRLRETLTRHEGFRDKPYKCSMGYWTIGIGRNLETVGLSLDEVLCLFDKESSQDDFFGLMFENDIEQAKKDCWKLYGHVTFTDFTVQNSGSNTNRREGDAGIKTDLKECVYNGSGNNNITGRNKVDK